MHEPYQHYCKYSNKLKVFAVFSRAYIDYGREATPTFAAAGGLREGVDILQVRPRPSTVSRLVSV